MATRIERCNWCNAQLMVPQGAQAIRCYACHGVMRIQTYVTDYVNPFDNNMGNWFSYMNNGQNGGYYQPIRPSQILVPKFPSVYGRKRAVLCGVSHRGKNYKIKGSVNDVHYMRYFLMERLGFPNESILVLSEDEMSPQRYPTKQNIRMALKWLMQGSESGDSLVFHFSGHGSRERDYNGDELDGMDEAICPLDFETEGKIIDDEINQTIVRPLPKGATLHAVIDACYSATVLDLPYVCRMNTRGYYAWEDHRTHVYKGTSGGLAVCISASDDHDLCMDTNSFAPNASTGALTYSFIQAVQNEPGLTYGRLLTSMRNTIRAAKAGGLRLNGPIASLVNRALFNFSNLSQEPQLSSSEKFELYSKPLML